MPYSSARTRSPNSRGGTPILADTKALARLASDLRRASPEAWRACRTSLRVAALPIAEDIRQATSYSSRIPATVRIRTGRGNVRILIGGPAAPNAAPIENHGKGHVRHPVFGDREDFTDKNSHPAFAEPVVNKHREPFAREVGGAITDAVTRVIAERASS